MALFFLGVMAVAAYAYTPSIKVGGKVYALTVQDSRPDADESSDNTDADAAAPKLDPATDAYSGIISATKMWWLLVPLLVISSGDTYAFATGEGEGWVALIGIAFWYFLRSLRATVTRVGGMESRGVSTSTSVLRRLSP